MEAPLPAQPDDAAPGGPQPKRQRERKKQRRERETHFTRALKWARNVPIPTHYPISDKPWSGKSVYDPKGCRRTLIEFAFWCGDEYVERNGYEPQIPLHPTDASDYPGLLPALGININVHRLRTSALGRLGLIEKTEQGRGNRRDRSGNQQDTRWTRYRLNIAPVVTSFQPELSSEENRTEQQLPMSGKHGPTTSPMSGKHGPTTSPMSGKHGPTTSPMSGKHGPTTSPMSEKHGRTPRPLYMTSERDRTTESGSSADITMQPRAGGGEGSVPFCSDVLFPSLENAGLTGFRGVLLEVVSQALPKFRRHHQRLPDDRDAAHVTERLVTFIRQMKIDVAAEPHRLEGYIKNRLGAVLLEGGQGPGFREPEPEPEPERQPREAVRNDWKAIHDVHSNPRTTGRSRTQRPGEIWDAALGELQLQVARPAFETWLKDTDGIADGKGEFIVGTANDFVSEILTNRMYPLIERVIERVTGEPTKVRFMVVAQGIAYSDCPLCEEEES